MGAATSLTTNEGIPGHEEYRDDLALMYFPIVDPETGRLSELRLTPMRIHHFKTNRASDEEAAWLRDTINREARRFDVRVELRDDGRLALAGCPT